jgi:hypothetical protein
MITGDSIPRKPVDLCPLELLQGSSKQEEKKSSEILKYDSYGENTCLMHRTSLSLPKRIIRATTGMK